MPINAGKMEILRDFYNTENHRIRKLQQVAEINPLPPHYKDEINFFLYIEKQLTEWEDSK